MTFQTIDEACATLQNAGFTNIEAVDRHDWFRELAHWELEQLSGPRHREFVDQVGEEDVARAIDANRKLVAVTETGELRPSHLRAQWPE